MTPLVAYTVMGAKSIRATQLVADAYNLVEQKKTARIIRAA
jgi:hypothetical protein